MNPSHDNRKTLNQERVMAILRAAEQILSAYETLGNQLDLFRKGNESMISIDAIYETFSRYRPPIASIKLIAQEKAHFEARWKVNQRARVGMKKIRNEQHGLARDYDLPSILSLDQSEENGALDLSSHEFNTNYDDRNQNPRETFAFSTKKQQPAINSDSYELPKDFTLPEPSETKLKDYHELLRRTFGATGIFKGFACRAIQEAQPSLTSETVIALVEQLLDKKPPGSTKQYLSEAPLERVIINDV